MTTHNKLLLIMSYWLLKDVLHVSARSVALSTYEAFNYVPF